MASLMILDPMIRGGAIALFLLWIAILARDHGHVRPARVAIAMNLSIIAYLLVPVFSPGGRAHFPCAICDDQGEH